MVNTQQIKYPQRWWHWPLRFLLFIIPLEILLTFVPVPPKFEAGVWHGNSYRERLLISNQSGRTNYNSMGYRDIEWSKTSNRKRIAFMGDSRFFGQYVGTYSNILVNIGE